MQPTNRVSITKIAVPEDPLPSWRIDPVICGQFTDWKPRPMLSLFEFFQRKEAIDSKLDYLNVFNFFVKNFRWGSYYHIEEFDKCTKHHFTLMDAYIKERKLELYFDWKIALTNCFTYKKPFFVNSEAVKDLSFDEIYMSPVFAKSGRQTFVI